MIHTHTLSYLFPPTPHHTLPPHVSISLRKFMPLIDKYLKIISVILFSFYFHGILKISFLATLAFTLKTISLHKYCKFVITKKLT